MPKNIYEAAHDTLAKEVFRVIATDYESSKWDSNKETRIVI